MISRRAYWSFKYFNGLLANSNGNLGPILSVCDQPRRQYSSDPKKPDPAACCQDNPQTKGREVEPWPKADPPPVPWRCECPQEPQPVNYDPYRIRVPETVVPPLPPSNVKPMLDCARTRGPCSAKPPPDPPPCPVPPKKPFPMIYVYALLAFLSSLGLLYKYYVYRLKYHNVNDTKPKWRPRRKVKVPLNAKDLPPCVQYLIIGAGYAGWSAYQTIKKLDPEARVFFVNKEDNLPYERPPMSKHMWYNAEPPDFTTLAYVQDHKRKTMYMASCKDFVDPFKFYQKKKGPAVSQATGWCCLKVDADDHVAWIKDLCKDIPIYYERCLIAVGSKPRNLTVFKTAPKAVRDKATTLRTIRDLEIAYRKVREAKHITIVGGGVLGTELAYYIATMHKHWTSIPEEFEPVKITHVVKDTGVLASILPEYLSLWATEKLKCQNVQVIPKAQVYDAFQTEDERLQLTLSNGETLTTDYVLVAVGTDARVDIAPDSFLEVDSENGGFLVNTELEARTHLYVAGDAASLYSQWKDTRIRMEHAASACEQGEIAGQNMTGYWTPCNMEPHYRIMLEDTLQVEVVGEVGACMPTIGVFKPMCKDDYEDIKRGEHAMPCYKQSNDYRNRYKSGIVFYIRDETVVGMVFWNFDAIEDRVDVVTEMLRARPSYKDINLLAELLGYPSLACVERLPPELRDDRVCFKASARKFAEDINPT